MKKRSISSGSKLTIAIVGITLLGFLGYRVMQKRKSMMKKMPDLQKDRESEKTNLASVEPSETKNVNDGYLRNVSGISELMRKVAWTLLKTDSGSDIFASREEFLGEFIRNSFRHIVNPMWYERLPKNIDELEELLKSFNLYDKYKRKLLLHSHAKDNNDYRIVYEYYTVPTKGGKNRRTIGNRKEDCLS